MDSKIQQLTETIYKEGLQRAREEEVAILKDAKEKAAAIEAEAQKEAEKIIAGANDKANELKRQVDSEIKMTMSQAVSAIKQEITSLISMKVVQPPVKELFSNPEFMQDLIAMVVKGWLEKESFDLKVILPEQEQGRLDTYIRNSLSKELNQGLSFSFSSNVKSG